MTISSNSTSGSIKKEGIVNSPISSYNNKDNNNNNNNNNSGGVLYQRYSSSLEKAGGMIAQQRLPVHLEYLQTHITTTESKASPLALLAATCSSIGKTDNDDSNVKTTSTSILNKLSTSQQQQQQQQHHEEDTKPSFKPYKLEVSPSLLRSSTASLTSSDHSSNLSSTSSVPSTRVAPELEREKRCYSADATSSSEYPAPLKCHSTSPTLPHLSSSKSPYVHGHAHSHTHRDHHMECVQCNTMRPHSDPLPIMNRSGHVTTGSVCQCPMCHQARDNIKCHYQGPGGGGGGGGTSSQLYPGSYKSPPNFAPLITCRDPNCTNCSKFSHTNFQNFLHPALIHQCTHSTGTAPPYKAPSYPVPPPPAHVSAYDPYAKNPGTKPYVCNWVSDGKHCGNTFVSSEELFQHLRTHTNSQQQANHCDKTHDGPVVVGAPSLLPQSSSVPPSPTCNIHGCPCGAAQRKSSPKQHGGHGPYGGSLELSRRYSPYSRMMPNSGSSVGGHSYPPHSLYHY